MLESVAVRLQASVDNSLEKAVWEIGEFWKVFELPASVAVGLCQYDMFWTQAIFFGPIN